MNNQKAQKVMQSKLKEIFQTAATSFENKLRKSAVWDHFDVQEFISMLFYFQFIP